MKEIFKKLVKFIKKLLGKQERDPDADWFIDHVYPDGSIERIYSIYHFDAIEERAYLRGDKECWWINKDGYKFNSFAPPED